MSVWDEEPDSLRMFYDLAVAEALRHDDIRACLSLNRAEINASALRGIMREDAVADSVLDGEVRYERLWHLGRRLDRSRAEFRTAAARCTGRPWSDRAASPAGLAPELRLAFR
ncbi:hypothetical protein [Streptomyces europaeiscabiei]|uniref:hypothetical protein n=1 Tax=Streptomyces europaeiscabiei TaxID=146819 RepID=UPI002E0EB61E|nr:hypothetical protein OHB30_15965 [Streptomyces europaeiscabiei]